MVGAAAVLVILVSSYILNYKIYVELAYILRLHVIFRMRLGHPS